MYVLKEQCERIRFNTITVFSSHCSYCLSLNCSSSGRLILAFWHGAGSQGWLPDLLPWPWSLSSPGTQFTGEPYLETVIWSLEVFLDSRPFWSAWLRKRFLKMKDLRNTYKNFQISSQGYLTLQSDACPSFLPGSDSRSTWGLLKRLVLEPSQSNCRGNL